MVKFTQDWLQTHWEDHLDLLALLPPLSLCWNYKQVPLYLVLHGAGISNCGHTRQGQAVYQLSHCPTNPGENINKELMSYNLNLGSNAANPVRRESNKWLWTLHRKKGTKCPHTHTHTSVTCPKWLCLSHISNSGVERKRNINWLDRRFVKGRPGLISLTRLRGASGTLGKGYGCLGKMPVSPPKGKRKMRIEKTNTSPPWNFAQGSPFQ